MFRFTLNRFKRHLLVAGVVAGAIVPVAAAGGGQTAHSLNVDSLRGQGMVNGYQPQSAVPDVFERYVATHSQLSPDVFERYVTAHPYGQGLSLMVAQSTEDRIVDDSFRDTPSVAAPPGDRLVDDYFRDAPTLAASVPADGGFNWGDWAVGIGSGIGMALLLAAGLVTSRQVRQRVGAA
jgi:hypothetical protein